MVFERFDNVYTKFKMHFYHEVFKKWKEREASLTTVETFCMEVIYTLGRPTISEFAEFISISSANAADKVNHLIQKGYVKKIQSKEDKRRFYLEPTQKYLDYYNISSQYQKTVMERIAQRFSADELKILEKVLTVMDEELMADAGFDCKKKEIRI